ncbi:unnamed protein product, partial [Allacma fusca]
IIAVYVDNGFLRKNESEAVEQHLKRIGLKMEDPNNPQKLVPSKQLTFVKEPEEKWKIIGDIFMKSMNLNPDEVLLGQGTLRPDLIESASQMVSTKAETIKRHNNLVRMRKLPKLAKSLEPFKEFRKDDAELEQVRVSEDSDLNPTRKNPEGGIYGNIFSGGASNHR